MKFMDDDLDLDKIDVSRATIGKKKEKIRNGELGSWASWIM